MKADPPHADLAINPALVEEILVRFIRNEVDAHRISPRPCSGSPAASTRASWPTWPCKALGPENVLAVTMPYKTSSEATRRDSQAVVDDLGLTTLDVPITRAGRRLFRRVSRASRRCGWPTSAPASG